MDLRPIEARADEFFTWVGRFDFGKRVDAAFASAADVPDLIDEVKRLRAEPDTIPLSLHNALIEQERRNAATRREEREREAEALREFADAHRFPSDWIMFRRDDGTGVTVSDMLREVADRLAAEGGDDRG